MQAVEVAVTWSEQQVTLTLLSPEPPPLDVQGTVNEPIFLIKRVQQVPTKGSPQGDRIVVERQKNLPEPSSVRRRRR